MRVTSLRDDSAFGELREQAVYCQERRRNQLRLSSHTLYKGASAIRGLPLVAPALA